MRRIGLIGGTTYHSTLDYYRIINEQVAQQTGWHDYAPLALESLNFADIQRNNAGDDQEANSRLIVEAALRLASTEVEALVLCANTLHMFETEIRRAVDLPIVHIVDATAADVQRLGLDRVALLGTKYTMNMDFYQSRLSKRGITCITPEGADADNVHETIYNELARGDFSAPVKQLYLDVIDRLHARGASGVILGCTEIPLLLAPDEIPIPSFNTLRLHCSAAVDFILGGVG